MTRTFGHRLEQAVDRGVARKFSWHGRRVPAFQLFAGLGLSVAVSAALASTAIRGLSLVSMTAAMAAAGASCVVFALGYKVVTGHERLVFLHHLGVSLGAAALVLRAAGEPILPYAEILSVCFGVLLAVGRLGCLCAGCCHGRPYDWGVRYGERHVEEGFPESLSGVRLGPVQLLESAWSALASLACLAALAADTATGLALACFLPLYATSRFVCELLRGDSARTGGGRSARPSGSASASRPPRSSANGPAHCRRILSR